MQYSRHIIDTLIYRLFRLFDGNALHFDLRDKVTSFSVFEFSLMTRLKIMGNEATNDDTQRNNRLYDTYF